MSGGPFGKPLFGTPAVAPIGGDNALNGDSSGKNETPVDQNQPKRFTFKKSALSSVADNMWKKSQSVFNTDQKSTPVQLEKKTLNDVLGKAVADKEKKEAEEKPSVIFGSQVKEKVLGEIPTTDEPASSTSTSTEVPKSSLTQEATAESTTKFREESANAAEALKREKEKHLAEEVEVKTGEEGDRNICQAACKLHAFDKEKKVWVERGLCQLRINKRQEDTETHYRIVARSTGNQRVIINSKIFSDMFLERVDRKRIKLSATGPDCDAPQIFLVSLNFSKTDQTAETVFNHLENCLATETPAEQRKRKASEQHAENSESDSKLQNKREKVVDEEEETETTTESTEADTSKPTDEGEDGSENDGSCQGTSSESKDSTQDTSGETETAA
ncbi:unnamed protein product, partial [Mesorhabditis spiculigera]